MTLVAGGFLIPRLPKVRQHPFDIRGVVVSTAGILLLVLAIIEGPQWGWASAGTLACFAGAAVLLTAFTLLELRTEGPLLDVRVFKIPRFTGGARLHFGGVLLPVRLHLPHYAVLPVREGLLDAVGRPAHAAVRHRGRSGDAHRRRCGAAGRERGSSWVSGLLLMGGGLVVAAFNSSEGTAYWGPIVLAMVLLALGLSSITAPTAEAVMGSVSDEQRGAAAGVNNTTRELGGTLGVAVFGSIFASSYAPKIISAFRPLPIPAGPKAEAHQSMAAALAVVGHAPRAARPALESIAFNAFHSGLQVACIAGRRRGGVRCAGAGSSCCRGGGRPRCSWRASRRPSRRASVGRAVSRDRDRVRHQPRPLSGVRALRECLRG